MLAKKIINSVQKINKVQFRNELEKFHNASVSNKNTTTENLKDNETNLNEVLNRAGLTPKKADDDSIFDEIALPEYIFQNEEITENEIQEYIVEDPNELPITSIAPSILLEEKLPFCKSLCLKLQTLNNTSGWEPEMIY